MENNQKKLNFFDRVIISIKDFEQYALFAVEKTRVAITYLAILILIYATIIGIAFTYKFSNSVNKAIDYFKNNIYEITYTNNTLSINSGEEIKLINSEEILPVLIINTNANKLDYQQEIDRYQNGILLLNDRLIYKNALLNSNMEYEYKYIANNYQISEFDKEDVLTFIADVNNLRLYAGFFIIVTIYMFIIYFISTIVDILVLGILGYMFARIVGLKLRFKAAFNMGIYAMTLSILLNMIYIVVNATTGLQIKYFNWMYTTISYIYMIVAILMIKADFINKQVELMRIIQEQEKVKQEIEENERRKKEEEQKQREKEKGKEEKKEKKKGKKKEEGLEDNRTCTTGK